MPRPNRQAARRRLSYLDARIAILEERVEALDSCDVDHRAPLIQLVGKAIRAARADDPDFDFEDFDDIVDAVEDMLDEVVDPANPLLEWLSDVGIHLAAYVAAQLYKGTEKRLARRLARLKGRRDAVKRRLLGHSN